MLCTHLSDIDFMWVLEDWGKTVTTINLGIENWCPEMHAVIKITMVKICKNHQIHEHSLSLTKSMDINSLGSTKFRKICYFRDCMHVLSSFQPGLFSHKLQSYIWRGSFQLSVIKLLLIGWDYQSTKS